MYSGILQTLIESVAKVSQARLTDSASEICPFLSYLIMYYLRHIHYYFGLQTEQEMIGLI